jgi:hypothetical protein
MGVKSDNFDWLQTGLSFAENERREAPIEANYSAFP